MLSTTCEYIRLSGRNRPLHGPKNYSPVRPGTSAYQARHVYYKNSQDPAQAQYLLGPAQPSPFTVKKF